MNLNATRAVSSAQPLAGRAAVAFGLTAFWESTCVELGTPSGLRCHTYATRRGKLEAEIRASPFAESDSGFRRGEPHLQRVRNKEKRLLTEAKESMSTFRRS